MVELLVALNVVDPEGYQAYRDAITPMLERAGGGFPYDFAIAETLKSAAPHPVNRLFVIRFPDQAARERFFGAPAYQEARQRHFERSVAGVTVIAESGSAQSMLEDEPC